MYVFDEKFKIKINDADCIDTCSKTEYLWSNKNKKKKGRRPPHDYHQWVCSVTVFIFRCRKIYINTWHCRNLALASSIEGV